jgi:hypothetical protein
MDDEEVCVGKLGMKTCFAICVAELDAQTKAIQVRSLEIHAGPLLSMFSYDNFTGFNYVPECDEVG